MQWPNLAENIIVSECDISFVSYNGTVKGSLHLMRCEFSQLLILLSLESADFDAIAKCSS